MRCGAEVRDYHQQCFCRQGLHPTYSCMAESQARLRLLCITTGGLSHAARLSLEMKALPHDLNMCQLIPVPQAVGCNSHRQWAAKATQGYTEPCNLGCCLSSALCHWVAPSSILPCRLWQAVCGDLRQRHGWRLCSGLLHRGEAWLRPPG